MEQQTVTVPAQETDITPQQLQANFNRMFGGRKNRRAMFRAWLKRNGVPKPIFQTIKEKLSFTKLNYLTFLDDLRKGASK